MSLMNLSRKFKVGDMVRVKRCSIHPCCNNVGLISRVKSVTLSATYTYHLEDCEEIFSDTELEFVPTEFSKEELKERYIVKFRNGKEAMFDGLKFRELERGQFNNKSYVNIEDFNGYLNNKIDKKFDIVEVYKPQYQRIWIRTDEIKEITMAEVEEKFGCRVRIKKEENNNGIR